MKLHTHFKFLFPYEVYKPVIDGGIVKYQKRTEGNGMMLSGQAGTIVLVASEQINIGEVVRNLRDPKGNNIFIVDGQPYDMYVHEATPVADPYGVLVGWRHILRRNVPRDREALYNDLVTRTQIQIP